MTAELDLDATVSGVIGRDRSMLGRAITLIESRRQDDQELAERLLERLLSRTGGAVRIGITGVPGVGKSTFIDAFGCRRAEQGHRVAVLAVDPSSPRTGGSILGDKTRMPLLAVHERAFIRPSPSAGTLGGVAARTREAILLCEAAGFDLVIVETVGAGQSETEVAGMVDFFLVLALPGAGDDLQGIKKGVLELADLIAVNKADGDNQEAARRAAADYQSALRIVTPKDAPWHPPVLLVSGLTGLGQDELWQRIQDHRRRMTESAGLQARRSSQRLEWMWSAVDLRLREALRRDPAVAAALPQLERSVLAGTTTPGAAARRLLRAFGK